MSESIALDYTAYEPKPAHFLSGAHHNDDYAIGDQAYVKRMQGLAGGLRRGSET